MSITYNKDSKMFNISTNNTTYLCGIIENDILIHIYYGKRVSELNSLDSVCYFTIDCTNSAIDPDISSDLSTNILPLEYSGYGSADFRKPSFHAVFGDGSSFSRLRYKCHKIFKGKPQLDGLPAVYVEDENEAETLVITLVDKNSGIEIDLFYTALQEYDAITRSVRIRNCTDSVVQITSALSCMVDFSNDNFDFIHLYGSNYRECSIQKTPIFNGGTSIDSTRGASSHQHNPFFALASKNMTESEGEVFGFNLIYSGNFIAGADVNEQNNTRAYIGINPFNFNWKLKENETFQTPEVVMVYSDKGLGQMSRRYHKLYRERLIRGKYRDCKRPVVFNSWEGTYYDFNEETVLNNVKKAKEIGIELFVLDDGWFSNRNSDDSSLGDWTPNLEKLPNGIAGLSKKINDMGLKFGLWFEPEMISPKSELYIKHPDWCLNKGKNEVSLGRNQLVLDLTNNDVCEYIIETVSNILRESNISYVKWDMNRNMTEVGSNALSRESQQEVGHRYILGLYKILDKLTLMFPDVLFESCASGGGRVDAGMLYYMPQCWISDNTDAVDRISIQYGTSVVYPVSSIGSHISVVPNHMTNRITDIIVRGDVATFGRFGYELDLSNLSEEECEIAKKQIARYHEYEESIHNGDMYRLLSPFESNVASWEFVSYDKRNVILAIYTIIHKPHEAAKTIKLQGLDETGKYRNVETGEVLGGDVLMNIGIKYAAKKDFDSKIIVFEKQKTV